MRLLGLGMVFVAVTALFADTITLKNGRVINGTYLGGTARQVKVEVGDRIETLDVSDVSRIEFRGTSSTTAMEEQRPTLRHTESAEEQRSTSRRTESNVMRPEAGPPPQAVQRSTVELPAGTNLSVRMIDGVDSETARLGQTFAGSLDEPVMLNGETVIPRGADVTVKLVDSKESGKLTGRAELTLDLMSVRVNGRMVDINTQSVSRESSSRGERTAKVAGGTAAVGAIIGAIAGGGKGAAIGAGVGSAAGAGVQVFTRGQQVKVPSETLLEFRLQQPATVAPTQR
jgi:hypothetical protein